MYFIIRISKLFCIFFFIFSKVGSTGKKCIKSLNLLTNMFSKDEKEAAVLSTSVDRGKNEKIFKTFVREINKVWKVQTILFLITIL